MDSTVKHTELLQGQHVELMATIQHLLQQWRNKDDGQLNWTTTDLLEPNNRLLYDISTLVNKWFRPIKPYRYRPLVDPDRWALQRLILVLLTPSATPANAYDELDDNACFVTKLRCEGGDVGWYMHLPPYQHNQNEIWDHCIHCGKPLRRVSEAKAY